MEPPELQQNPPWRSLVIQLASATCVMCQTPFMTLLQHGGISEVSRLFYPSCSWESVSGFCGFGGVKKWKQDKGFILISASKHSVVPRKNFALGEQTCCHYCSACRTLEIQKQHEPNTSLQASKAIVIVPDCCAKHRDRNAMKSFLPPDVEICTSSPSSLQEKSLLQDLQFTLGWAQC